MAPGHVFEAIVIAVIMLGAVTYVVTYDGAQPANRDGAERLREQQSSDFLSVYAEWPLPADECRGRTMLERFMIDGIHGNTSAWDERVRKFFAPGTDVSLLLDNGLGVLPLQEKRPIMGATQARSIAADWHHVLTLPPLPAADGTSRYVVDVLTAVDGQLVMPSGEAVRYRLGLDDLGSSREGAGEIWGGLSLPKVGGGHSSIAHAQLTGGLGDSISQTLLPDQTLGSFTAQEYLLYIAPPEGQALRPGIQARVTLPVGWEIVDAFGLDWLWVIDSSAVQPSVTFTLLNQTEEPQELQIRAQPPSSPIRPFDVISARLSNGSLSESHFVVKYPAGSELTLPRSLYATTSYPVALGSSALFGVTFVNGGAETRVTHVDIEIPGGYDLTRHDGQGAALFRNGTIEHVAGPAGTWSWQNARHIRWTPSEPITVTHNGVVGWLAMLPITDDASQVTGVEPARSSGVGTRLKFTPPALPGDLPEDFTVLPSGTFESRSYAWASSPGVTRHYVQADDPLTPELDGYPWYAPSASFTAHGGSVSAGLSTSASYTVLPAVADITGLEAALVESSLRPASRMAPAGSFMELEASFEPLVKTLRAQGLVPTEVALDLYAPPSMGCRPTKSWAFDANAMPHASMTAAALWNAGDVPGAGGSLFLASQDGHAYRIDRVVDEGVQRWSRDVGASLTSLTTASLADGSAGVFVTDALGRLSLLDAESGDILWRETIALASLLAADPAPRVVLDESGARVLVAMPGGHVELRRALDGAFLAERDPGVNVRGETPRLAWTQDGAALVAFDGRVHLLDGAALSQLRSWNLDAHELIAGAGVARAATGQGILLLPLEGGDAVVETTFSSSVLAAASGDLNADGVDDLVLFDETLTLRAYDGATGAHLWTRHGESALAPAAATSHVIAPLRRVPLFECVHAEVESYHSERDCMFSTDTFSTTIAELVSIQANANGVVVAYLHDGLGRLVEVDAKGQARHERAFKQTSLPTAAARGTWGATSATILTTHEGGARIYDHSVSGAAPIYEARPGQFLGSFQAHVPVPKGGFFGTHIAIATLTWLDLDTGLTHNARVLDWFNVVGSDGKPVNKPAYQLVLVTKDRGES